MSGTVDLCFLLQINQFIPEVFIYKDLLLPSQKDHLNHNHLSHPHSRFISKQTSTHHKQPTIKMQFSTLFLTTLLATLGSASPFEKRQFGLCSSALDSAECCDVSVDGVANLNCASRMFSLFPTLLQESRIGTDVLF